MHDWCYTTTTCHGLEWDLPYFVPFKWKCNGGAPYCSKIRFIDPTIYIIQFIKTILAQIFSFIYPTLFYLQFLEKQKDPEETLVRTNCVNVIVNSPCACTSISLVQASKPLA